MTIGQRIAQKRKEQGLSQEALGDQLGISRQAIYKWEADSALPEIDKLIALSRLFGVSVGWLLGVEDPPASSREAAADGELTEAQLKMVEEIAGRYIAAQPAPQKRRRWPWVLAGLALCMVLFNLFGRLGRMDSQYANLQNSIYRVESSMDGQINSLSNRVEEILKAQNSLLADCGVELKLVSLRDGGDNGMALFSAYAVPKTFQAGMTAEFSVENGTGGVQTVPGILHPDGKTFQAESISTRLTDSIRLSFTFISADGTRQTQLLDQVEGLYSATMPAVRFRPAVTGFMGLEANDSGLLTLPAAELSVVPEDSAQDIPDVPRSDVESIRMGLFKNKALVTWLEPCAEPEASQADSAGTSVFRLPAGSRVTMTGDGDQLCFAAVVTDEYGRQAVYSDIPYVLQDGVLTWPPTADTSDHDPACWQYGE